MYTQRNKSKRKRRKSDYYPTPVECADAAIDYLFDSILMHTNKEINILDPGAGDGVWGDVIREYCPKAYVFGIEIEEYKEPTDSYDYWRREDYLKSVEYSSFDLIVGNPPYSLAQEFVEKSLELVTSWGFVYFLLRLSFLEAIKRYEFWKNTPLKSVVVLSRRPSFFTPSDRSGKPTDAMAYGMFLWQRGYIGIPTIDWLMWNYDEN